MSKKSRNKGAGGEREFIQTFAQLLDCPGILERNLVQSRSGGHDSNVSGQFEINTDTDLMIFRRLDQFAIEIKRYAQAKPNTIAHWWQQAVKQSQRFQPPKNPLLAFRLDRERWQCLLHVSSQLPIDDIHGCIRMDIVLLAEFVKNPNPAEWLTP